MFNSTNAISLLREDEDGTGRRYSTMKTIKEKGVKRKANKLTTE